MKKRLLCILLSALILMGLVPAWAVEVSAASEFTTSDACIEILKEMEGFVRYPVYDYGQYTVGYGTRCPDDMYETYKANGISTQDAEILMRKHLAGFEYSINGFADKNDLKLTQNMFDALILFTYNVGTGWTIEYDSLIYNAIVNGTRGSDLLYAMSRWSKAGSTVSEALVKRRLIEADMYLNGSYTNTVPENYVYVLYQNNGGVNEVAVQGYDACEAVAIKAVPTRDGHRFLGWYDAAVGGKWISMLDASVGGKTLYAHWQAGDGSVDASGNILGTSASYTVTVGDAGAVVKSQPGAAETLQTLAAGTQVTVTADYVDGGGVKWGLTAEGKWVNLSSLKSDFTVSQQPTERAVNVRVTANGVNIRNGAGTSNARVGTAYYGQKLTIVETTMVGDQRWGRFSGGWICLMYTDYDAVLEELNADTTTVTAIATVVKTNSLRIRSGPGTWYEHVGNLSIGTSVEITQQKTINNSAWGRISRGWICLDYCTLTKPGEPTPDLENPKEESKPEDKPADTPTETPSETPTEPASYKTGTVVNTNNLNVRKAPGTKNAWVKCLKGGTKVKIYEESVADDMPWGRTDDGWVCMYYIQLDADANINDSTSTEPTPEGTILVGTVINTNSLRIRSGPGTNHSILGTLTLGTTIEILERTNVGNQGWGRYSGGWVCLDYINLKTVSGSSESFETGTVVNTNALRIRSAPGTNNGILGTLTMGTKVAIYEKRVVGNMTWGRIDQGWISLSYVRLDTTEGESSATIKTINTATLRIRQGPGTDTAHIGNYKRGEKVEILEIQVVNNVEWGKTTAGWICMLYVI